MRADIGPEGAACLGSPIGDDPFASGFHWARNVLLGKDAAVEGKVYARVDGSDTVYVIGTDLKTQLNKKPDDFRDRKLADITTQQINRVVVKTKGLMVFPPWSRDAGAAHGSPMTAKVFKSVTVG